MNYIFHRQNFYRISRNLLMNSSHIDSKNTFAKTLKELHEYGYIIYQPELHKGHYPKVTVIRLTDREIMKNQLDLFPDSNTPSDTNSGTRYGTGVVPIVNRYGTTSGTGSSTICGTRVVPDVSRTGTTSGTEVVPEVVHLIKQYKQIKTIECETHAPKYPTMKEVLNWVNKKHISAETALASFLPPFNQRAVLSR